MKGICIPFISNILTIKVIIFFSFWWFRKLFQQEIKFNDQHQSTCISNYDYFSSKYIFLNVSDFFWNFTWLLVMITINIFIILILSFVVVFFFFSNKDLGLTNSATTVQCRLFYMWFAYEIKRKKVELGTVS